MPLLLATTDAPGPPGPLHLAAFCFGLTFFISTPFGSWHVAGETVNWNASAVVSGEVRLPCDINPPTPDDRTLLVLWYKEGIDNPIYSLDLRGKTSEVTPSFPSEDIRNRSTFRAQDSPAHLLVERIRDEDQGVFRCRVDFQKAPTRNYVTHLGVIVPPENPTILGEKGLELSSVVGPYNEGASFFLSCETVGGRPPPQVTWWRDSMLLDNSYEVTSLGIVRNDLVIQSLSRNDFNAVFTCQGSNNNITQPASTNITVDMNLKPLEVKIMNEARPLSAKKRYELVCESSGSRPLPILAWYKGNRRLKRTDETVSDDNNVTTSVLIFVPTSDDHGKQLSCRAENPAIPGSGIQEAWDLNVHFSPIAVLELGSSIRRNNIREGDDVVLECNLRANPEVTKIDWKFQGKIFDWDDNISINNHSLLIPKINRTNAGSYSCVGVNDEGVGESGPFHLKVKHAPVCKQGENINISAARNEEIRVRCEVEAHPTEVTFHWTLNGSGRLVEEGRVITKLEGLRSTLVYSPRGPRDFGILNCWAANEMGEQQTPCAFLVSPAGPPDPAQNCSVVEQAETSLVVTCVPGYDGGLPQTFGCEVIHSVTRQLLLTVTNSSPVFHVTNLPSGAPFLLFVYASNERGRSNAVMTMANTLDANDTTHEIDDHLMLILGAALGGVVLLAILAIAIVFIVRSKTSKRQKRKEFQPDQRDRSHIPLRQFMDDSDGNEEKSPDLILNSKDQEFPSVKVKCLQTQWAHCKDTSCENCVGGLVKGDGVPPLFDGVNGYRHQLRKITPKC